LPARVPAGAARGANSYGSLPRQDQDPARYRAAYDQWELYTGEEGPYRIHCPPAARPQIANDERFKALRAEWIALGMGPRRPPLSWRADPNPAMLCLFHGQTA